MAVKSPAIDQRFSPTIILIVVAACVISFIGFGTRSVGGLFLEPMTLARGWSRETFALALAWQNLMWGLGMLVAGVIADRHGAVKVMVAGAVIYALGLATMANVTSASGLYLTAGLLTGLGVAFTSFSLALAAMAKIVAPARRSLVLGIGTAAGSLGQVVFSPLIHSFMAQHGWVSALYALAASVFLIIPLALFLPSSAQTKGANANHEGRSQSVREAFAEALSHRGFVLLTLGFFVCGFHVGFIVVHFPAYIRDLGLPGQVGAYAIALLGLFNIAGAFLAGLAGQRWRKRSTLSVIYFARAIMITTLLLTPISANVIYLFAAAMGLLWLSTVPLTTGIVAQVFGVRYMATLFGVVFLSHQVGSFLGVWLGGRIYDNTGSYAMMWWTGVMLSLFAALVHLPIDERPLARLQVAAA